MDFRGPRGGRRCGAASVPNLGPESSRGSRSVRPPRAVCWPRGLDAATEHQSRSRPAAAWCGSLVVRPARVPGRSSVYKLVNAKLKIPINDRPQAGRMIFRSFESAAADAPRAATPDEFRHGGRSAMGSRQPVIGITILNSHRCLLGLQSGARRRRSVANNIAIYSSAGKGIREAGDGEGHAARPLKRVDVTGSAASGGLCASPERGNRWIRELGMRTCCSRSPGASPPFLR